MGGKKNKNNKKANNPPIPMQIEEPAGYVKVKPIKAERVQKDEECVPAVQEKMEEMSLGEKKRMLQQKKDREEEERLKNIRPKEGAKPKKRDAVKTPQKASKGEKEFEKPAPEENWEDFESKSIDNHSTTTNDLEVVEDESWESSGGKAGRKMKMHNTNKNQSSRYKSGSNDESGWNDREEKIVHKKDNVDDLLIEFEKLAKQGKIENNVLQEKFGDLFDMGEEYALAHCVAQDMNMGSGIATTFRSKFKKVDELLEQRQKQGGLAFLEVDGRYIYYLVTKRESHLKPTYETLFKSLVKLKDKLFEHDVKKLAIPRIGCGLDRLEWSRVSQILEFLFKDAGIEIVVCGLQPVDSKKSIVSSDIIDIDQDFQFSGIQQEASNYSITNSYEPVTANIPNTGSEEAYQISEEHVPTFNLRDDSTIYGELVASKHRKYSAYTQSVVEHLIGQILFNADMGRYNPVLSAPTQHSPAELIQNSVSRNSDNYSSMVQFHLQEYNYPSKPY